MYVLKGQICELCKMSYMYNYITFSDFQWKTKFLCVYSHSKHPPLSHPFKCVFPTHTHTHTQSCKQALATTHTHTHTHTSTTHPITHFSRLVLKGIVNVHYYILWFSTKHNLCVQFLSKYPRSLDHSFKCIFPTLTHTHTHTHTHTTHPVTHFSRQNKIANCSCPPVTALSPRYNQTCWLDAPVVMTQAYTPFLRSPSNAHTKWSLSPLSLSSISCICRSLCCVD